VGLVAGAAAAALWTLPAGPSHTIGITISASDGTAAFWSVGLALLVLVTSVTLLVVVHELLHAAVFPGGCLGARTVLGVWPAMGVFYAHHDGPQSRNRMLLVLLMPFLVLTLGLWLVEMVFPTGWGSVLGAFSIVNALFAGGDLLGTGMIAWQVPVNAEVRNQGWKTWWRVPTVDVEEPLLAAGAEQMPAVETPQEA
jgi:hypothetical protein